MYTVLLRVLIFAGSPALCLKQPFKSGDHARRGHVCWQVHGREWHYGAHGFLPSRNGFCPGTPKGDHRDSIVGGRQESLPYTNRKTMRNLDINARNTREILSPTGLCKAAKVKD